MAGKESGEKLLNRKICVVGLGLIGGSIALAIKKEHDATVVGVDVNSNQLKLAQSLQVIDEIADNLEEGIREADLIVLAAPVKKTEQLLEELQDLPLKEGAIVTDVGSTKSKIFQKAAPLHRKNVTFIGGHPMAGSHKSGVQAARAHLFENAFYVLTPSEEATASKVIQLQNWLKGTNARFIEMTPKQHDKLAGLISHFPHIVAASLVHQVKNIGNEDDLVSQLAAGGFKDITRIASSNPEMWRDILLHNKDTMLHLLRDWQKEMKKVETMLLEEESNDIYNYFQTAKKFRDCLPSNKKGALPSFYDLYVDIPDHPGVISDVTGILGKENISITNIRIIETREDIMGALRLSFRTDEDRKQAKQLLENALYETHLLEE
ncbi:prephenate dehydrogenase [Aliibacillus thermotolerans]|uniref:Prephenate dehydrogenase n=1 Tax=Aliibacillus thermotolerans TaxID=1834418 RepID=A0ABW0U6B2_9BACI|nr:prephenate dehydrogenase [Aliibacillus thermotolerans]MDA3130183.1 prephenate dehydrogenase [Aliibacillus thermotolerans]